MNWNVVCRLGGTDAYLPPLAATDPRLVISFASPGAPNTLRCNFVERFGEHLGGPPAAAALDLVNLAAAVFTADLCILRELGEDRWTREITVHLPVEDLTLWTGASSVVAETLAFLTGDRWSFEFRPRCPAPPPPEQREVSGEPPDVVSLFSGGLDSLVGVIDLLDAGHRVALVGHYGAGMTHTYQHRVSAALEADFPGRSLPVLFHAQPPAIAGAGEREQTMRSRSFLFFSLGVGVASRLGEKTPLYVPENGLISINVPLTAARSGSLSTRTTHPHYVALYRRLLAALGLDRPIVLPYRLKTKGKMLQGCTNQAALAKAAPLTMSCAHSEGSRWQGDSPGVHCGYCYPCLIRRAAAHSAGTADATYTVDVRTSPPDPTSRKGRDFRALAMAIERFRTRPASRAVFDVLDSGPVPPDEISAYAEMYRRGMRELAALVT